MLEQYFKQRKTLARLQEGLFGRRGRAIRPDVAALGNSAGHLGRRSQPSDCRQRHQLQVWLERKVCRFAIGGLGLRAGEVIHLRILSHP